MTYIASSSSVRRIRSPKSRWIPCRHDEAADPTRTAATTINAVRASPAALIHPNGASVANETSPIVRSVDHAYTPRSSTGDTNNGANPINKQQPTNTDVGVVIFAPTSWARAGLFGSRRAEEHRAKRFREAGHGQRAHQGQRGRGKRDTRPTDFMADAK